MVEIDLRLSPPRLDARLRIHGTASLEPPRLRRRLVRDVLPVVLHEQVAEDDLDLVGGEEASRAGVLPVAEAEVRRARGHELPAVLLSRLLSLLGEPRYVELLGLGVDLRVTEVGEHGQSHALGDLRPVG